MVRFGGPVGHELLSLGEALDLQALQVLWPAAEADAVGCVSVLKACSGRTISPERPFGSAPPIKNLLEECRGGTPDEASAFARIEKCALCLNGPKDVDETMREKRSMEKKQLPGSSYEMWLQSQKAASARKKHRVPEKDLYEAWVRKRVDESLETRRERISEQKRKKAEPAAA